MHLPGYPKTRQGWDIIVKNEGWAYTEVKSRGRMGTTREYELPKELLQLISMKSTRMDVAEYLDPTQGQSLEGAEAMPGEFVTIDKYINVKGAAGAGQDVHDEAIVQVRIDARFLRERMGNNLHNLKLAGVSGDSMYPTLSHGDQVLVDTSVDRFVENAIYAIQQDGHLRYKRIQLKLDGSIIVRSDNENYNQPETYTAEEAQHFKVVGIVIPFKFGRFKL